MREAVRCDHIQHMKNNLLLCSLLVLFVCSTTIGEKGMHKVLYAVDSDRQHLEPTLLIATIGHSGQLNPLLALARELSERNFSFYFATSLDRKQKVDEIRGVLC